MSASCRLWLAIAAVRQERQFDCAREVYQMAGRNKDRLHTALRSEGCSDHFALINKLRPRAALRRRLFILPDEDRFGAAKSGPLDEQSDVRGNPDTARVGYTLPVEHHGIRLSLQLGPGFQNRRRFTKREQARNIRKAR